MSSSDQLAREAQASRERLKQTMDELRARLAPGNLIDEAKVYLRNATVEPIVADAPPRRSRYALPLALIGAGLAWLALEARRGDHGRGRLTRATNGSGESVAGPVSPTAYDPDVEAMSLAMDRRDASEPVRRSAPDLVQPVASAPDQERTLTPVESISITPPAPGSEEEKHDQRPLPL